MHASSQAISHASNQFDQSTPSVNAELESYHATTDIDNGDVGVGGEGTLIANQTAIFNPNVMATLSSMCAGSITKHTLSDPFRLLHIERLEVLNDLIAQRLDTTCKNEYNSRILADVVNIFNQLPRLTDFKQSKPSIPEFDEIMVQPSDTVEIKKFIRKVNYEMLGYHCNHKTIDANCGMIYKNIGDVYASKEFKAYKEFIDNLVVCVTRVRHTDSYNEAFKDSMLIPSNYRIREIIDKIMLLNARIATSNSITNPECSKCKAQVRKYEYSIREIQRMRDELAQQREMDDLEPVDADMTNFMNHYFPAIERIPLRNIKDRYKEINHESLTMAQLTARLEETGLFTISNVHRTYFAVRK